MTTARPDGQWVFSMTPQHGPMWDLYEKGSLVAYARRDGDLGWYVRVNNFNYAYEQERLYIGDDVHPPAIATMLLELHRENQS